MDRLARGGTSGQDARDLAAAAVVVIVAVATYLPSIGIGFLSDDFLILGRILDLHGLHGPLAYFGFAFYDYYRPFVFLSHALDWTVWGWRAEGFHATNVALHGFNTLMLFLIGRRLTGRGASMWGAVLFAVHPACQESVFWVAGRFDLVATAAITAGLWFFSRHGRMSYWLAVVLFAVALLSKESGVALLILVPAFDVFVRRLGGRRVIVRLLPFLAVSAAYTVLRSAADLSPIGGTHRIGKLALLLAGLFAVLWMAYRRSQVTTGEAPGVRRLLSPWAIALASVLCGAAALVAGWLTPLGPTVGFAWYAAYFLGPLAWLPPGSAVAPGTTLYLVAGAVVVAVTVGAFLSNLQRLRSRPTLLFALTFLAAALIPVLSMPSQTHMYLAVAGVVLVTIVLLGSMRGQRLARAMVVALVVLGAAEAVLAARDWRRAGTMTRQAVAMIDAEPGACSGDPVVLLVAPASIRGVPCNLNDQAFRMLGTCVPALQALLRVVGGDLEASVTSSPGAVRIKVNDYRGNLVGTTDLQHFVVQIPRGRVGTIDTPLGRLRMWPEDGAEWFELTTDVRSRAPLFFYYSDGAVHRVASTPPIR